MIDLNFKKECRGIVLTDKKKIKANYKVASLIKPYWTRDILKFLIDI